MQVYRNLFQIICLFFINSFHKACLRFVPQIQVYMYFNFLCITYLLYRTNWYKYIDIYLTMFILSSMLRCCLFNTDVVRLKLVGTLHHHQFSLKNFPYYTTSPVSTKLKIVQWIECSTELWLPWQPEITSLHVNGFNHK